MAKVLVGRIRFGGEEMWLPERFFCDNLLTFILNAAGVDRLLTVGYSEGVVLSPKKQTYIYIYSICVQGAVHLAFSFATVYRLLSTRPSA